MFLAALLSGCGLFGKKSGKSSRTTGWAYNSEETVIFRTNRDMNRKLVPDLYSSGCTFTMGRVEQDVMYNWDNHREG